jgi:hypothetical protein
MPHTDAIILSRKLGLGQKLPQSADHQASHVPNSNSRPSPAETAPTASTSPPLAVGAPLFVPCHSSEVPHG